MAETRFIKTVTFGGYDKTDVDKRLDYLYTQVYELKNELREAKLALEKYKKGTEEEKTHEHVLSVERAKLTEVQVKNETMSDKLKAAEEDNKLKDKELEELKKSSAEMKAALDDASSELAALKSGSDAAALSVVFIEAQKSRSMLLDSAKKEAADLEADSKKLAENMIIDADNKAAKIIYDAEKQAAEITADALNKAEEMKSASGNMKASLLEDIGKIGAEVAKLKAVFDEFENSGHKMIAESEALLSSVENELNRDGVPVFKIPEHYEPELPKLPEYKPTDFSRASDAAAAKKSSDLDKLQAMADSIGGGGSGKKEESGSVDLDALAKQAEAIGGGNKKGGSSDLEALAKQAEAIGGGNKKKGGGMSLDELAKQAAALGGKK